MPNLRISELLQRTPNGLEYLEVIIPPFVPGTNRKVLLSEIFDLAPSQYRGDWPGTTTLPATGGTLTGGFPRAGDRWRLVDTLVIGSNVYDTGTIIEAAVSTPGQILSNWNFYAMQLI